MYTNGYNSLINGRRLVVYGTGNNSKNCASIINKYGLKIDYFTNSNTTNDVGFHLDTPLMSSNKLDPNEYFVVISVLNPEDKFDISTILNSMGFVDFNDYISYEELTIPIFDIKYYNCNVGKLTYGFRTFSQNMYKSRIKSIGRYTAINGRACVDINHANLISQNFILFRLLESDVYLNKKREDSLTQLVIGNDVWIGANAFINASSCHSIGDGAIIGAGAVVTHDVPAYAVVVGVPARILKYRFSTEQIEILLRIKWWARKEDWLRENKIYFENMDLFFEHFKDYTPPEHTLDE